MTRASSFGEDEVTSWTADLCGRVEELLDEYRGTLHDSLNGLSEEEARQRLVPSKTTLLGLLKHVTYVEGVWLDPAVTGRSYAELGIPSSPTSSFDLRPIDTIASVQRDHQLRCEISRAAMMNLPFETVVHGRGDRPVWTLQLQVLRELAQHAGHAGHADIVREQVLARRTTTGQD